MSFSAGAGMFNGRKQAQPEILMNDAWEGPGAPGEDAITPRRRGWVNFRASPIARKIITFNLIALLVLVAGVMALNPSRDRLVQVRERALVLESMLIAQIVAPRLAESGAAGNPLEGIALPDGVELFLFDASLRPVADSRGLPRSLGLPPAEVGGTTGISDLLNAAWDGMAWLLSPVTGDRFARSEGPVLDTLIGEALRGRTLSRTVLTEGDALRFALATPLRHDGQIIGTLGLVTAAGEIDRMVRAEREQVLQVFIVALIVSIGLSLVLASTIANPLRDLAAAARAGHDSTARKQRSDRVRIPNLSARPDEIGELSGALRDMVAALYDRIESNEQFAADVAHELKNPLSSLRSATETMRRALNEQQRARLLDVIDHDVNRLDRLVSDISNASRLDSELVKAEMEPFDLVKLLGNIVSYHRHEAREKGIDFVSDLPQGPLMIEGLEARLAQVFVNLLSNAISFCEEGDTVRIWARKREDRVLVVVEDTGPGIPEGALERVFERFYSERAVGEFGQHSGLGLSISKQIVDAHGGAIWAENIRPTDADPTSEPLGARFVVGLQM